MKNGFNVNAKINKYKNNLHIMTSDKGEGLRDKFNEALSAIKAEWKSQKGSRLMSV